VPAAHKPTPAELLDLLVTRANALRASGVRRVELEGLSFDLAAPEPDPSESGADEADGSDPLYDPATFGRRDGKVPGFQRQTRDEEYE
jgi:hypothetical protein